MATYLKNLVHSVKNLVGSILIDETLMNKFLRQGRTIELCDLSSLQTSSDIQVIPFFPFQMALQSTDTELVKFPKDNDPEIVQVFRNPIWATLSFGIACPRSDTVTKMMDADRLSRYFFENRTIEPFIPEELKQVSHLYQKMVQTRAQLRANSSKVDLSSIPGCIFSFDYTALYHSGTPVREEKIVQRRILDVNLINREK